MVSNVIMVGVHTPRSHEAMRVRHLDPPPPLGIRRPSHFEKRNGSTKSVPRCASGDTILIGVLAAHRVLLEPDDFHVNGPWPHPCQGLQGTDSMYPYQLADGSWAALVGTSHEETPDPWPQVGWWLGFDGTLQCTNGVVHCGAHHRCWAPSVLSCERRVN